MTRVRSFVGVMVAATALIAASGSAAKEFGPGDLRVCDATRCVPVTEAAALQSLFRFIYAGPPLRAVPRPRWGAPTFELRFRNGYVTGVVGGARLDRFLSFGVHLERFRRGTWYRMYPRAAAELRELTASLDPLRLTPAMARRSR